MLYLTDITANGEVMLVGLRPRPLINVVLDTGCPFSRMGATMLYLERKNSEETLYTLVMVMYQSAKVMTVESKRENGKIIQRPTSIYSQKSIIYLPSSTSYLFKEKYESTNLKLYLFLLGLTGIYMDH